MWEDRFAAPRVACLRQSRGDERHRFVPRRAPEAGKAFRPFADRGVEQTIASIDSLAEPPYLRADVAVGDRVERRPVYARDAPVLQRDVERAGVGTVERTHRLDGVRGDERKS